MIISLQNVDTNEMSYLFDRAVYIFVKRKDHSEGLHLFVMGPRNGE